MKIRNKYLFVKKRTHPHTSPEHRVTGEGARHVRLRERHATARTIERGTRMARLGRGKTTRRGKKPSVRREMARLESLGHEE